MSKPRVYRIVRLPNGQLVKEPIKFDGTQKLERKMFQDAESKLWLYKKKYQYVDQKNQDKS